ncbi:MAG: DUF1445 domain-containing protein [Marivibrio sp.]|uniref:D-glutamate cyclase family protein n=1 Tax=Marivibrio sp. TaxID=2039719 RepID=UPI0032EB21AA
MTQATRADEDEAPPTADAGRSPTAARRLLRDGLYDGPTGSLAAGRLQTALVLLPEQEALAFATYCQRNPKALPLLAMSRPGERRCPQLGADIDLARDLPAYRVVEEGVVAPDEPPDIEDLWRPDLVAFALGTAQPLEIGLLQAGLELRHRAEAHAAPLYETNIPMEKAGPFGARMWVSMRPFYPADAIRAIEAASRFPKGHGAPVHFGDPGAIGIDRLSKPDLNPPSRVRDGEVPVFWASARTAEAALLAAGVRFAAINPPGKRLITDWEIDRARG